jgi:outer membrane immunogenic protein
MSMKRLLCVSIAASALMTGSAAAADFSVAPIYEAPPAPVSAWTGSYLSISGGSTWGSAVVDGRTTGVDQAPGADRGAAALGITGGLQFQRGSLVLGYEGDTWATGRKPSAFDIPAGAGFGIDGRDHWLSTLRGRVGVTQDNWLLYTTAGVALAHGEQSTVSMAGAQAPERHWHWGWTVGAGVEVKLSQDWSAKVEYLYVGLQDKSYFSPAPNAAFQGDQRTRLDDSVVRFGVNYKLPWSMLDGFFKP